VGGGCPAAAHGNLRKEVYIMEFANNVVTLIANSLCCVLILAFIVGVVQGIRFMLQAKNQDKEEYERKKEKEQLDLAEQKARLKN
jgi:predicted alpha/beta hydrolase family esterase